MNEREIPNYWQGNCFGCSRTNTQGLQLRFWLSDRGCFTKCTIPDSLCGLDGLVHGGIIALLLDELAQWTMIGRLGRMGLTREISVRYLKPVLTNTEIIVEAQIVTQDDKEAVLHSSIHSIDNVLLAEGDSRWLLASLSKIAGITNVDELTLQEFLTKYPVI